MILSPSQIETIRSQSQQSDIYLSIFRPTTILSCKVNSAPITKGAITIPYNTVSAGSFTSVESGMILLVGSVAGKSDYGRVRVRSITSTQMIVAENSHINWKNDLFLTVLKYVEVLPIYPRIINDPGNAENVIFYKDYDIPYTNQNTILGTFVCSGPHRAAFKEGSTAQIYYSSSGTYNLNGETLSHSWWFDGASVTGSSLAEPGFVSYPNTGHFVTRHIVSGTSGGIDTTYRYVSIYDRPGVGPNLPIRDWEFSSLDGSRDGGGYTTEIIIREPLPTTLIGNEVIVFFTDDFYNDVNVSLGGNSLNNEKIFFVGYIDESSIKYNYEESSVSFKVGSVTDIMKKEEGFAISVENKADPSTWYELKNMDCRKALYHYLRWHSTVLMTTDFRFNGLDRQIQYFDSDRESLYDAINNFMSSTLVGEVVSDRQGMIWSEVTSEATPDATASFPPRMNITKRDWMNQPDIKENVIEPDSYLEMGGIAYSGPVTGTFSALMSCAPGNAPGYHGRATRQQGLALTGQSHLNQLVGSMFAHKNAQYPSINAEFVGNYRNLDIAPLEALGMYISQDDTNRNITISGSYYPRSMSWSRDSEHGSLIPSATLNVIVTGTNADTIVIPDAPSEGGVSQPGFRIPPLPTFAFPAFQFATTATNNPYLIVSPTVIQNMPPGAGNNVPLTFNLVHSKGSSVLFVSGTSSSVSGTFMSFPETGIYQISFYGTITLQHPAAGTADPYLHMEVVNDPSLTLRADISIKLDNILQVGIWSNSVLMRIPTANSAFFVSIRSPFDTNVGTFGLSLLSFVKICPL